MSEETSSELTVGRKALAVVVVVARLSLTVARCVKCPLHDGKGWERVSEKSRKKIRTELPFLQFFSIFLGVLCTCHRVLVVEVVVV